MLMEMFMMDYGRMIRRMVTECIIIQMAHGMKANGLKINNMETVKKSGQTTLLMKEIIEKARNMVKESFCGLMVQLTLVTFLITTSTALDYTHGQTAVNTTVNGLTTRCMVEEYSPGLMVDDTKENTSMIKSKEMVCSLGQTVENMRVNGTTVNNMELEFITPPKVK